MGVGLEEAGIDEVLAVVEHLRVSVGQFLHVLSFADVGEDAILGKGRLCEGPLLVHGDDVAENDGLTHKVFPYLPVVSNELC